MWLQYTSCLFVTLAIHAFYIKRYILGTSLLIQNQVSIIHHAHYADPNSYLGGNIVHTIDRVFVNANWLYTCWRATRLNPRNIGSWIVWFSLLYMLVIFYLYLYPIGPPEYSFPYNMVVIYSHTSLHIAATVGMHIFLLLDK